MCREVDRNRISHHSPISFQEGMAETYIVPGSGRSVVIPPLGEVGNTPLLAPWQRPEEFRAENNLPWTVPSQLAARFAARYPPEQNGITAEQAEKVRLLGHYVHTNNPNSIVNLDTGSIVDWTVQLITATGVVGALVSGLGDRRDARKAQLNQDFNAAFVNLTKPETRLAGSTTLHDFLNHKREEYYEQIFRHTVALLRGRDVTNQDSEYQAFYTEIVGTFVQCVPLLREKLRLEKLAELAVNDETGKYKTELARIRTTFFNASRVRLNGFNLEFADLSLLMLEGASFAPYATGEPINVEDEEDPRRTKLYRTNFSGADLNNADFSYAYGSNANFRRARLRKVVVLGAKLSYADFTGANCELTDLAQASKLKGAILENINNYPKEKLDALYKKRAS